MGNNGDMSGGAQGSTGPQQQGVQATGSEQTLRMQQAEALLRSQAEAALRLAVSTLCFLAYSREFYRETAKVYTLLVTFMSLGVAGSSGGSQFRGWRRRETSFGTAQRRQHLRYTWTSHEPADVSAR